MSPIVVRALRRGDKTLWKTSVAHAWSDAGCDVVVVDEFAKDLSARDEIESSAKKLVGLRHPNLATVRDVVDADGACLVVSDFVDGERLDVLRESGKLEPEIALRIVVDVLHALGALHDVAIVHGHVEPANVVVGEDGVARVVRGWLGAGRFVVIEAGAMHRVAPEVLRQQDANARADVYGVGVLLKELLPDPLPKWAAPIAGIAATALAPDPALRFATTADMARDLRLAAKSHVATPSKVASFVRRSAGTRIDARRAELVPPSERPPEPVRAPAVAPYTTRIEPIAAPKRASQTTRILRASLLRMSRLWAATAGAAVVLAASVAWLVLHTPHPAVAAPAPTPTIVIAPPPAVPVASETAPAVEIELPDTEAQSTPAPRATPHHRPARKPVDRSAVF